MIFYKSPFAAKLWACGESVNPPKVNIQEVQGGGLCPLDQRENQACYQLFRIFFNFGQITSFKLAVQNLLVKCTFTLIMHQFITEVFVTEKCTFTLNMHQFIGEVFVTEKCTFSLPILSLFHSISTKNRKVYFTSYTLPFQDSDSVGSSSPERGPQRRLTNKPQLIKQHSDLMAESRDVINQTGSLSPALRDATASGLMLSGTSIGRHRSALK